MTELASVIIVNYNHKKYLEACITSILKQDPPHEIIIVDNCSSDDSIDFITNKFSQIRIVKNIQNLGYGAAVNIGVRHANGKYLVILNPDTIVEDKWLSELIKPLTTDEKLMTTPKILLYDGSAINTCGNIVHFTGLGFTNGLKKQINAFSDPSFEYGISGCCFAIKKTDFETLSGFDERFFLYCEDTDLTWRAYLNDFRIMYVPWSVVRHDYKLKLSSQKIFYLERNRYLLLRKYLSVKNLVLLSPSLLLTELLIFGFCIKNGNGFVKNKVKSMKQGLSMKVKKIDGDKNKIFKSLTIFIPTDMLTNNKFEKLIKTFTNQIFMVNMNVMR